MYYFLMHTYLYACKVITDFQFHMSSFASSDLYHLVIMNSII